MICATVDTPGTFAHQAALRLLELYPELGQALTQFPSTDALWGALHAGLTNVIVVAEQTTALGWDEVHRQVCAPDSGLFRASCTFSALPMCAAGQAGQPARPAHRRVR